MGEMIRAEGAQIHDEVSFTDDGRVADYSEYAVNKCFYFYILFSYFLSWNTSSCLINLEVRDIPGGNIL